MSLFGDHTIAFYLELKMIDCRTFIYNIMYINMHTCNILASKYTYCEFLE